MKKKLFSILTVFVITANVCFSQTGNWYKGDLHSHSTYSDGDSPVSSIIANAESKGFNFYVITDHDNTYTPYVGNPITWSDTAYHSNNMILLYGMEWTTDIGHAGIWNSAPFPYDSIFAANTAKQPAKAASIVKSQGGLFSINHPLNGALLWDVGYDFEFPSIEILNGPISYLLSNNNSVITTVWEPLLMSGKRITGVGGSDMHKLSYWLPSVYPNLGSPSTWVYSAEPNGEGIIDGIRNGHVCISNSPTDPRCEFFADIHGNNTFNYMMGDAIADTNSAVTFRVNLVGSGSNLSVKVIKNGIPLFSQPLAISSSNPTIEFTDTPYQRAFYRIELLSGSSSISWTNPIYCGYQTETIAAVASNDIANQISIYPNPTQNLVNVQNNTPETISINLINVCGQTLKSVTSSDELITIGMETLSKGIYFIKINNYKTFKIIKQ